MNRSNAFFILRLAAVAALLISLPVVTGCGPGVANISGTVTYKGQPLTFGSVQFDSKAGGIFAATIQPDGTYTVRGVPSGPARVLVSAVDDSFAQKMKDISANAKAGMDAKSRGGKPGAGAAGATTIDPSQFSKIPMHYGNFDTSKLTVEVKRGEMKHDIPLE